tara:strand:- start:6832 stop:7302 length:471 start_codon:yes stop_codon:yes gene_type:complete
MIKIDVLVQEKKWKNNISSPKKYIINKSNKIRNIIPRLKNKKITLTILLTNNKYIKKLNKQYRGKNKTTDVLSFPFYKDQELKKKLKKNKNTYLGDIILNYNSLYKLKKLDFKNKFNKLWIHGLLHLIGYKHYKNKDFYKMQRLENKIYNKIKIIK